VSNESDQNEVYVQQFPVATGKWQVSRNGGLQPLWRGDGKELFFLAPDATLMAAAVDTSNGFQTAAAQPLFPSGIPLAGTRRQYAVARDGHHFLMTAAERSSTIPLTVVVNWPATLRR
jgi:eukaryotic-like serine/threonine-protein kinase